MGTECTERYSGCAYCEYSRIVLIGLVGTSSIWICRNCGQLNISLKIGYIGGLERKLISTNPYFKIHIYLRTNKILPHNSFYVSLISNSFYIFEPGENESPFTKKAQKLFGFVKVFAKNHLYTAS